MTFEVFQRPKVEPPHPGRSADCGTVSGYTAHIRAEEEPDEACKRAWTAWHVDEYAANPVFRSKKLRLSTTRTQALEQLAKGYPDEFRSCWQAQTPGGHRRDRAREELRKRHQAEFDAILEAIRAATPVPFAPDRRRKDNVAKGIGL